MTPVPHPYDWLDRLTSFLELLVVALALCFFLLGNLALLKYLGFYPF